MDCPNCGAALVAFPVPEELRAYLPQDRPAAAICRHCLHLTPLEADEAPEAVPDFATAISEAFPHKREAAREVAVLVGLLSSIALNRDRIQSLVERIERGGTDPFLVLDRLANDGALEPEMDLDRRLAQLRQLVE